ncbi:hypothetical protein BX661DRAFT_173037 [Kickxella alabastrina]|uniref:uncharacterized protein n=1 Tax=Kickxella alabastrina TaxID=61397 RepID=UPI00221E46BE|nr:uncharacterized protein BX661DRAFT_173037 [Kickxella alabastrina]KAI7822469.1 hypothetical protein BX661DRAFT_173037 [Kickxella alabastrina]
MQFYLDEADAVPICLFAPSNAPSREPHHHALSTYHGDHHPQEQEQEQEQEQQHRSVPGHPYIRFVEDSDLDGNYPFDAFQDLRGAYASSPLTEVQARMRSIQHQRAQAQLHRTLLEQQLREHEQRERALYEEQMLLEHQRRTHARVAAERARAAYLGRMQEEERHRQMQELNRAYQEKAAADRKGGDEDEAVFYPPFHFFGHILDNQIKNQDSIERKRAEKAALTNLLETYFGHEEPAEKKQTEKQDLNANAARRLSQLDPAVLDNVLRVVHNRLDEIAKEEEHEKTPEKKTPEKAESKPESSEDDKIRVNIIDEASAPAEKPQTANRPASAQKGVEIEEPVDYSKLADSLRRRVNGLSDNNTFVPPTPHLGSDTDDEQLDPPATKQSSNNNSGEHTDSEFASMMDSCKSQLRNLQDATKNPDSEAARHRRRHRRHRHNRRLRRSRSRRAQGPSKDNIPVSSPDQTQAPAPAPKVQPEDSEQERQKRAVNTMENYIMGQRNMRKAHKIFESLRTLRHIDNDLEKVRQDYNWRLRNLQLSFVSDNKGNLKLAYNSSNKDFHEYQEVLQRLLIKLDSVESFGDDAVRSKRKNVVKKIQATLDALDRFVADQESEVSESSVAEDGLADESSNGDWF